MLHSGFPRRLKSGPAEVESRALAVGTRRAVLSWSSHLANGLNLRHRLENGRYVKARTAGVRRSNSNYALGVGLVAPSRAVLALNIEDGALGPTLPTLLKGHCENCCVRRRRVDGQGTRNVTSFDAGTDYRTTRGAGEEGV